MPRHSLAAAALLSCAGALSTTLTSTPKQRLRTRLQPSKDALLVDPTTKQPMTVKAQYFNGVVKRTYQSPTATYGQRFSFVDLAEAKRPRTARELADELRDQIVGRTSAQRVQEDTFRNPFVSFLYERGWRQGFERSGFPGADEEFKEVEALFGDALSGPGQDIVLDISCGTGLFTRRLVKAKHPETRVIAADYSESMLVETKRRLDEADLSVELYRVDVAQLPFASGALSAVHAGAALHCWVQLEDGLKEIRRVLKPGAPFFATTFLVGAMGTNSLPKEVRDRGYRFFETEELKKLFVDAGFVDVVVRREEPACAVITCAAPGAAAAATGGVARSAAEWRAACDAEVVSFYDFGVRM
jgi:SAM-dependent methyltransferase